MRIDATRTSAGAAGFAALAALTWAVLAYAPILAICAMSVAIRSLCVALHIRVRIAAVAFALCALGLWAAFRTTTGYFWLNQNRLEALVSDIRELPSLVSLGLGHDAALPGAAEGSGSYDSYRFINDQLVSQYRVQVAPHASRPVLREIDVLRELDVPHARYSALRTALDRLDLSGFRQDGAGEVILDRRMAGGTPWGESLIYRPDGKPPAAGRLVESRRLARHWFHVLSG